jgi:hypothetical protein
VVKAERHVPGLTGENQEDRRHFGARHAPGRQLQEEQDKDGEAQDGYRLQEIQQRHEQNFRPPALGRERRVGECEDQRKHERD